MWKIEPDLGILFREKRTNLRIKLPEKLNQFSSFITNACVSASGVCAISMVADMSAKKNVSRPDMEKVPSILKSEKHI